MNNVASIRYFSSDASFEEEQDPTTNKPTNTEQQQQSLQSQNSSKKKTFRPWDDYYRALTKFQKEHGHLNVPPNYQSDPSLGYFVRKQRNQPDMLSKEQKEKLNQLGFDWETRAEKRERQWQEKYERLVEYRKTHGSCLVPKRYVQDETLGNWVDKQRTLYHQGLIDPKRQRQLDAIGFIWQVTRAPPRDTSTYDTKWKQQYEKLQLYQQEHGHCAVPRNVIEDPSFGHWVGRQRSAHRKGLLRLDRKQLLDDIGFVFDIDPNDPNENVLQQHWEDMFQTLVKYYKDHPGEDVPHAYEADGLGQWVAYQKKVHRRGQLDPIRKQRLLDIGFEFGKGREQRWQENYERLQAFHAKHGHCMVSLANNNDKDEDADESLAKWVFHQRNMYHQGKLPRDRQKQLEELGFVWRIRHRQPKKSSSADTSTSSSSSDSREDDDKDAI